MPAPITFVVSGSERTAASRGGAPAPASPFGTVKRSVVLSSRRAAQDGEVRVDAVPGEDIVAVHIAGGPSLYLHPEHARDLLNAQQDPARARGAKDETLAAGEVRVPMRLQWRLEDASATRGATRGFLGDVLVRAVETITGVAQDKAADFVASEVVKRFDSRVTAGVYKLGPDSLPALKGQQTAPVAAAAGSSPVLVLIHGTFSDTSGTFGKLWAQHPQLVRALFQAYGNRVYALDHPTLGVSPIANAITLAESLPNDAQVHLLTHSRGGLVAEVLARVAARKAETFAAFSAPEYADQRAELKRLADLVAQKNIRVSRVVRVACPARGTLLASKRLDAYVSVVKWALELAGVQVVPELVEFLGEVARRRADPETLPGLAAQIPDSPLVQWLHGTDTPIEGDLRVVAGDLEGDSISTWVKTLLSDAFYWTDNDLVVQTRSMYGGTPRTTDSTFLLDQGGKVSHFNYFSNADTAAGIVGALTQDTPDGFRVIGPLSWGGASATGVRAAARPRSEAAAAALPAVFILPGILGSNLKVGGDRVWLAWRLVNGFSRLAFDAKSVAPDGPIGLFYDDLATFLAADHDVIPFGFDWRRPIADEADRLADAIEKALDARTASKQPVRLLAHSMGGIVARTLWLKRPETWARMMQADGARLLMLGTPNGGSFAPMQVLSGDDTFGNMLTAVGAPFHGDETRAFIAQFPGLLQLQADLLGDLGKADKWQVLADADLAALGAQSIWHRLKLQLQQYAWGIPSQGVLDEAVELRRALDRQRDEDLATFAGKLLLVVGKAAFTPAGYELGKEGVVYLNAPDQGDGRVTLDSALLPGVETWALDCDHGSLPKRKEAFDGYRELLVKGTTTKLARFVVASGASRGAVAQQSIALVRSRPSRAMFAGAPPASESEVLAPATQPAAMAPPIPSGAALRVTVVNGDLTYNSDPLLIGHYRSSKLSGAEAAMDRAIGSAMSASLDRGLYPVAPDSHKIFVNTRRDDRNPWQLPRPQAVIVAGLGAEGELRGTDLVSTVRQAVLAWAQLLTERQPVQAVFTLATTLLGSGGTGVSAGQAAQLIAQGVREANDRLSIERDDQQRWPRVEHLRIIELYLDRAGEAWRSLQALADASPARYVITPVIEEGAGGLRRPPDLGYRGADYDFISALAQKASSGEDQIVYSIDSKRARSEVRALGAQVSLISNLVLTGSNDPGASVRIGRTLFNLLVPVDLDPFLGSSSATVLELNKGTAGIPWELLDSRLPGSEDDRPWAIRTKLLRKLQTPSTPGANDASPDDSVLVIGDPACDRNTYPKLFGARQEATAVVECLTTRPALDESDAAAAAVPHVVAHISPQSGDGPEPDATTIIDATMERPWRIIHIAAHGEPPVPGEEETNPRGVVLSGKDSFFGPREIRAWRTVPELVFVNCCYLATGDVGALLKAPSFDRAQFASGVAEALIEAGVRCVVAAGWAVDDEAASVFAKTFYRCTLRNASFIDAVAAARDASRAVGGNTWAAYQCYGDPDWRFRRGTGDAQRPTPPPPSQEYSGISSAPALVLALDTLAVRNELGQDDGAGLIERLQYLDGTFGNVWKDKGEVATAFGVAWANANRLEQALEWFEKACKAPEGTASLKAIEQLANLKVRQAWRAANEKQNWDDARAKIEDAMKLLDHLLAIGPTLERESLYGSAFKRLALIEQRAGRPDAELAAIEGMRQHYAEAEKIARARAEGDPSARPNVFYPAMNRIAAQLVLEAGTRGATPLDQQELESIRRSMAEAPAEFWSVIGQTELSMYASLFAGTLADDLQSLTDSFRGHYALAKAKKSWDSVYDNATFVLSKYATRAKPGEVSAVRVLLGELARLAGRDASDAAAAAAAPEPPSIAADAGRPRSRSPRKKRPARPKRSARIKRTSKTS
jgi:tetratricopeptide (TPR) repeat protein/triacylglycerol esterase/lipase EstA (alpha/beta hydrolase family)